MSKKVPVLFSWLVFLLPTALRLCVEKIDAGMALKI